MWQKIKALKEQRAEKLTALKAIHAKGETEKRDLTAEETKQFDTLRAEADKLNSELERLTVVNTLDEQVRNQPARDAINADSLRAGKIDGFEVKDLSKYSVMRAIRCLANKQAVDGFEGEVSQELAKRNGSTPQGFYFPTEIPSGPGLEQRTALNLTTGSGAKATILDVSNFIELLRNRLVIAAMGTRFLTGLVGDLALPKQTGGGSAFWVADEVAPTTSNQTIGQVTFAPQTLGAFTDLSRKFVMQSSLSAEAFVREDLAKIVAIAIDTAAINGTGANNQPLGLFQNTNIATVAVGTNGGTPTWANIISLESNVAAANADLGSLGYVTNAKTRGLLKGSLKSTNTSSVGFIWENGPDALTGIMNGYNARVTNVVPATFSKGSQTNTLSGIVFGNWNDLIVAQWGQLDIMVDPYSLSTTGSLRVVALQNTQIKNRHDESFSIITDVLAP